MNRKVEISHRTIIFTTLFLISLWFVYIIQDILLQLFVALLIMLVLNPTVTKLEKLRIHRAASVLIVYFCFIAVLVFAIAAMVPIVVEQTVSFTFALPRYLSELRIPEAIIQETTHELTAEVGKLPTQILSITVSLFNNVISVISVFLFGLYFTLARRDLRSLLDPYVSKDQISKLERILSNLEIRIGGWARGQVLLMFIVGAANFAGLTVLGVPYAVPLGLLAGVLEAIPNLGPIFAAVPAVLVGFGVSPITGVAVIALAFLIQQLEAYLFVPKVMQKSAGVNPIVSLLSLIIGFKVAGVVGAVLSIPIVLTMVVLFEELYSKRRIN